MTDDILDPDERTDETWRYGGSRLRFRSPAVDAGAPHVAVLGSSEVAGRYVDAPLTAHAAEALGLPVANLGVHNGGIDAFLGDEPLLAALKTATITVIHAMGAHAMSNRLYSVHPRRNDRVLCQSDRMRALWPEVDFTDYSFVRHMLIDLRARDAARFQEVALELRTAWEARMGRLLSEIGGTCVLMTVSDTMRTGLGADPLFVGPGALAAIGTRVAATCEVDVTGLRGDPSGMEEMRFSPDDRAAAMEALPPVAHERMAQALVRTVAPLLERMPEGGAAVA